MPTLLSTVTFDTFNQDPLPAPLPTTGGTVEFAYGSVVGGNDALATRDADASYVRGLGVDLNRGSGTVYAITCRAHITPSIPATATPEPGGLQHFQIRSEDPSLFQRAEYTLYPGDITQQISGWPNYGWVGGYGGAGDAWYDESAMPSQPVILGMPFLDPAEGYFHIPPFWLLLLDSNYQNFAIAADWIRLSFLQVTVGWSTSILPALRLNQRDDGLGISGAPPRIGGRSRSVQGAAVPRIGHANTYS